MKKTKKLIVLVLSCIMLLGGALTVQAGPENWCCGGISAIVGEGTHTSLYLPTATVSTTCIVLVVANMAIIATKQTFLPRL